MMDDFIQQRLSRLADKLQAKLRAVQQLQQILAEFPELAEELTNPGSPATPGSFVFIGQEAGNPNLSNFERIAAYLRAHDNQPKSVNEIADGTGMPRNSATYVLYTSHSAHFDKVDDGRVKLWKLKPVEEKNGPPAGAVQRELLTD